MLKEFFQAVSEQAVKAAGTHVFQPEAEPKHIYYLQDKDGDLLRQEAEPKPRAHTASSLDAVAEFAANNKAEGACVWYSRQKVEAVLKSESRRDRVTMPLTFSKQIKLLLAEEAQPTLFKQANFILWLRVNFKNCLDHCKELIDTLRQVKFENGSVVDSQVRHGKSSLGASIRSEISAINAIPEYVVFRVPVFEQGFPHLIYAVEMALEPVAESGSFKLIPLPGEIEKAIAAAENAIGDQLGEQLAESQVPIHYGTP